jgi:hypothetical protein
MVLNGFREASAWLGAVPGVETVLTITNLPKVDCEDVVTVQ